MRISMSIPYGLEHIDLLRKWRNLSGIRSILVYPTEAIKMENSKISVLKHEVSSFN